MHLTCLPCWTWSSQVAGDLLRFAEQQRAMRTIAEVWAAAGQRSGGRGPSENRSHFALLHGPEHGVLLCEVSARRLPLPGQDLTDHLTDRHICRVSAVEWAKGAGDFTGGDVGGRRVDRGHAPRVTGQGQPPRERKRGSDPRREHAGRWVAGVRPGDSMRALLPELLPGPYSPVAAHQERSRSRVHQRPPLLLQRTGQPEPPTH